MNNNTKLLLVCKHVLYCFIFLFFYILQTLPGFLSIGRVKPIWVIPAAIALAMFEGEFLGGVYGALAGLLCDMGGFLLFGFHGFITCLYCVAVGLLVIYLMRNNFLSCMLVVLIFMLLRGSLEFLFAYGMWGYENVWKLYVYQTLPVAVYSTLLSAAPFFLFRFLHRRLRGSS